MLYRGLAVLIHILASTNTALLAAAVRTRSVVLRKCKFDIVLCRMCPHWGADTCAGLLLVRPHRYHGQSASSYPCTVLVGALRKLLFLFFLFGRTLIYEQRLKVCNRSVLWAELSTSSLIS